MSDPALIEIIRAEIDARGPIPFARFMQLALYHPAHGYYAAGRAQIGRRGDFFTNVSVGPLFGKLLAAQFAEVWEKLGRPADFHIVEQGAHDGAFAADVLGASRIPSLAYTIIEPFPTPRTRQQQTLAQFQNVRWLESIDELAAFTGVWFANELFDALPVRIFQRSTAGAISELRVARAERTGTTLDLDGKTEATPGRKDQITSDSDAMQDQQSQIASTIDATRDRQTKIAGDIEARPERQSKSTSRSREIPGPKSKTASDVYAPRESRSGTTSAAHATLAEETRPPASAASLRTNASSIPFALHPVLVDSVMRKRGAFPQFPTPFAGWEECNSAAEQVMRAACEKLERGVALTIDYGFSRSQFFAPARAHGTLQVRRQHRLLESPFEQIGSADISSHVDWTTLAEAAETAGAHVLGFTDQHHFLTGILSELIGSADVELFSAAEKRALQTLLHPEMLGRNFQAFAVAKNFSLPLAGFRFGGDARTRLELTRDEG
ncbi:MAG: SAM-dependent methyltransferase [Verrucomicrobiota bacterium]|nr:SAM-dependent methyltransferase [Verrucomicrobiota bacterium]